MKSINENEIIVETNTGIFKGFRKQEFGFEFNQFLGIPYAKPPINELRFREPESLDLNNGSVIIEVNQWPPFCQQINLKQYQYLTGILNYNTSEDCLYMNIWTPVSKGAVNRSTGSLAPVMVYIHGGVFVYMGSSFDIFNGALIASLGDVVFVTFNYRLGVFGFLDTSADAKSDSASDDSIESYFDRNVGIYDQIMALNWIRDNIRQFGGDPDSITLMGQSAGAIAIGLLMATPLASDLFQRAILESSSPMQMKNFFQISDKSFKSVLHSTNCSRFADNQRQQQIECLRQIPEQQLNSVHEILINNSLVSFSPSIPSLLWTQFPREAFDINVAENTVKQKQILLGANKDEGNLFLTHHWPHKFPLRQLPDIDRDGVRHLMQEFGSGLHNLSDSQTNLILDSVLDIKLTDSPEVIRHKLSTLIGDFLFKCPVIKFADTLYEWPNTTVYMYYFTERSGHLPEWIGSSHFEEVEFVFGLPLRYPDRYSTKQQEFTKRLIKTWTQFARSGQMSEQLGNVWPKYTAESGEHMELNADKSSVGSKLNQTFYSLFEITFETIV